MAPSLAHGQVMQMPVVGVELDVKVTAGKGLLAKDGGTFSKGTSDPFVKVSATNSHKRQWAIGKTQTVKKSLDPTWNESFKLNFDHLQTKYLMYGKKVTVVFAIFDYDMASKDDPMGEVRVELSVEHDNQTPGEKWYPVVAGQSGAKKAKGELQLSVAVVLRHAIWLNPGNCMAIPGGTVMLGMGWDMLKGGKPIDLDTSCVGVSETGRVLMDETVYFADLENSNGSIKHSGDEREGDEDLGGGDDERIFVDLDKVPKVVRALFFIGTVATENHTFADVKTSRMRLVAPSGEEMCRYEPAMGGAHAAVFMCRVARDLAKGGWVCAPIGDFDKTARDFGTLVPEIKGYMADLCPGLKIDPFERVAVMRKGGNVLLRDYLPPKPGIKPGAGAANYAAGADGAVGARTFVVGLAWDVTNGVNIDLDVSVVMLDATLRCIDLVSFRKLKSSDGSIQHCGDEREGDAEGDDEKVIVHLGAVHPTVAYIGFVVNSYSGQELDDVAGASCHIFDPANANRDLATFKMTNTKELDKHTALVMGMLYRDPGCGEWALRIIAEPAQGRVAEDNVDELQRHIQRSPPQPLQARAPADPSHMAHMPMGQAVAGGGPVVQGQPVPVQQNTRQMLVECPAGVAEGQQMAVTTPQGEMVVTVPPGVGPGGKFAINLP